MAPTKTIGYNISNIMPTSGFIFVPFVKLRKSQKIARRVGESTKMEGWGGQN